MSKLTQFEIKNIEEDNLPLLEAEGGQNESAKKDYGDDFVETDKFCFCLTMKCGMILLGIVLILNFCFLLINCVDA